MNRIGKTVSLVAFVALLSAGPAFTQTPSTESTPEAKAAAPVAYVYVQTYPDVMAFSASADGRLTPIEGSPFAVTGQMGAISGKFFISVGTNLLHTYLLGSDGAVGKQISETDSQHHGGSGCGDNTGSNQFLDRTGKYFYLQLYISGKCAAMQTYHVNSDGYLQFLGDHEYYSSSNGYIWPSTTPSFTGNDDFAYGAFWGYNYNNYTFSAYRKGKDGVLEANESFQSSGPGDNPDNWNYYPMYVEGDSHGHLAAAMYPADESGQFGPVQLASFTIQPDGAIYSTNSSGIMPNIPVGNPYIYGMKSSPSGELLAVGGYSGLEVFHFNGSSPITDFTGTVLNDIDIDHVGWDNNNHLYALSDAYQWLYVFTVTPTSFTEAPGSPYYLPYPIYGNTGMVVVPKL